MPDLKISGLSKSFGDTRVLEDVSFEVGEGEFSILLGPSGCGKTTLLRIIAGLERQDAGEIRVGDREISDLTPRERDVAMVFQSYALYPHMSAFENIAFPLKARKIGEDEIDRRVRETARLLGIEGLLERPPRELSGGQRQRVAIGRAIVRSPRLFLFDEPLSNLDAGLRAEMRVELAKLHEQLGATMVYVTHDQVEAMTLGDKIVLLHEARVQQIGSPDDLYNRPSNLFVAGFIGSPRMNLVEGRLEVDGDTTVFRADGADLVTRVPDAAARPGGREDDPGRRGGRARDVVLGVRPEALEFSGDPEAGRQRPSPDGDEITDGVGGDAVDAVGRVEVVENIGSEALVHLVVDSLRLTARADADVRLSRGDDLGLRIPEERMHLFDATSGQAFHHAGLATSAR